MQVFLTGGTGYIGAAVLDSLIRPDTTSRRSSAIPRRRRASRPAAPRPSSARSPSRRGTSRGVVEPTRSCTPRSRPTPRGPAVDKQFLDAVLPALAAAGAPRAVRLHVERVGARRAAHGADETAALAPVADLAAWRPAHEAQVLDAARAGPLRAAVVRPGIVYGGARGIVSDMLKDALNGLVRVIGDGKNRWPCVYDRDLGDLYARILASPGRVGRVPRRRRRRRARARHRRGDCLARRARGRHPLHAAGGSAAPSSVPYAEALALDQVVRCPRARALGWAPAMHGITGNAPRLFEEYRRAASRE